MEDSVLDEYNFGNEDIRPLLVSGNHSRKSRGNSSRQAQWCTRRPVLRRWIQIVFASFSIGALVSLFYFWKDGIYHKAYTLPIEEIIQKPDNFISFKELMQDNFEFDIKGHDVLVFLHMQKTGGTTFGKHLVRDLDLERECECHGGKKKGRRKKKMRCDCFRPGNGSQNWLFSRYSTGWKCGLHPDWTELTNCVDTYLKGLEEDENPRRYFYITFLREPVARYLSEFKHTQRGATWKTTTYMCGGISWNSLIPKCYEDTDWSGVSLEDFMSCEHNMANNRQARMLADLELVGCHNRSLMSAERRDRIILASAKSNLEKMAYFGITEDQVASQYMFEETFNLQFRTLFDQFNSTHSSDTLQQLGPDTLARIQSINSLDHELYTFAKQLMKQRFEQMQASDSALEEHMLRLKQQKKINLSWDDVEDEY